MFYIPISYERYGKVFILTDYSVLRKSVKYGCEKKMEIKKENKNTINVGKIIRQNSPCNVSPSAINELISFLEAHLEKTTICLCEIAHDHKRKTIYPEDVIQLFSLHDNGVIPNDNE